MHRKMRVRAQMYLTSLNIKITFIISRSNCFRNYIINTISSYYNYIICILCTYTLYLYSRYLNAYLTVCMNNK